MQINKKTLVIIAAVVIAIAIIVIAIILGLRTKTKEAQDIQQTTSSTSSNSIPSDVSLPTDQDSLPAGEENTGLDINSATATLLATTPFFNEHFGIEYNYDAESFTISLFAIINHPEWQQDQYRADLKQYKYEALEWISQQGVSIYDINIEYVPEEAKDL